MEGVADGSLVAAAGGIGLASDELSALAVDGRHEVLAESVVLAAGNLNLGSVDNVLAEADVERSPGNLAAILAEVGAGKVSAGGIGIGDIVCRYLANHWSGQLAAQALHGHTAGGDNRRGLPAKMLLVIASAAGDSNVLYFSVDIGLGQLKHIAVVEKYFHPYKP